MRRFIEETLRLGQLVLVVSVAALVLYLGGRVPAHLQSQIGVTEFNNVEEAEAVLDFDIAVPSYFPSYLSWPPVSIQGQLEPFPMTRLLFLAYDQGSEVLLIYQIVSSGEDLPIALPWIETVLEDMPTTIGDSEGKLIIGERANGQPVNGVHWQTAGLHFIVVTTQPVQELLALANSMHP